MDEHHQQRKKRQWSWSIGEEYNTSSGVLSDDNDSDIYSEHTTCDINIKRAERKLLADGNTPRHRRQTTAPTNGSLCRSFTVGEGYASSAASSDARRPHRDRGRSLSSSFGGFSQKEFRASAATSHPATATTTKAPQKQKNGSFLDDSARSGLFSISSAGSRADECGHLSLRRLSLCMDDDDECADDAFASIEQMRTKAYIGATERTFKGEEGFEEHAVADVKDVADAVRLARRTRAVSALGNRLMAAPDEAACLAETTRLLALMFGAERVSFGLVTDAAHFLWKRIDAVGTDHRGAATASDGSDSDPSCSEPSFDLQCFDDDRRTPLEGTAVGVCVKSRKEHYTPRTGVSSFETHRAFYREGKNTALVTPILVHGGTCAGCIMITRRTEDGYKKADRVLIGDVGALLGGNIYAKRLLKDAEETKKRSREMLHCFIPPKVLDKIECYWDADSDEYKSRRSTSLGSPDDTSLAADSVGSNMSSSSTERVKEKIQLLKDMNRADDDDDDEDDVLDLIFNTSEMEFAPTSRALYAESVKNVCIVFTDIVGFSKMDITPTKIMDMLQNLFNRFDELCDVHGVLKLETIGDAYVCATNLMEDDDDNGADDAAVRALAMAKDMISEATDVKIPFSGDTEKAWMSWDTLQIRVGIHVGDVTCGVLGQRLPKFTTCGKAVNMAARMEQNSQPSCIRVTKDFHDAVGNAEKGWKPKELIPLKNMGEMETYLLDPLEIRIGELIDHHQASPRNNDMS